MCVYTFRLSGQDFVNREAVELDFCFGLEDAKEACTKYAREDFRHLVFTLFLTSDRMAGSLFVEGGYLCDTVLVGFRPVNVCLTNDSSIAMLRVCRGVVIYFFVVGCVPVSQPPGVVDGK